MRITHLLLLSAILVFTACEKPESLTDKQKSKIEKFSRKLVTAYNSFEPATVKSSWDTEALRNRVITTSNTSRSILDYALRKSSTSR